MASRLFTRLRKLESKHRAAAVDHLNDGTPLEVVTGNRVPFRGKLRRGEEIAVDHYIERVLKSGPHVFMYEACSVERPTSDRADFGIVYDAQNAGEVMDLSAMPDWEPPRDLRVLGTVNSSGRLMFDRAAFYGVQWPPDPEAVRRAKKQSRQHSKAKRAGNR